MASFMIPFKALFFLIVVLHQSPSVFASSSSIAENETETLLKWKASLANNTQTLLSSLWVGGSHCNWVGITCDMAGTITNLNLPDYMLNLKGTLHSLNFFFFPNLVLLNLRNNSLYGPIPSHIGKLSKLTHLDLSYNTFSGNIPSEISLLKSLELISLSNNEINGFIPQEIGSLSSVSYIYFYDNHLRGSIPEEVCNLSKLIQLDLSLNNFSGSIPSKIGRLSSLSLLNLTANNLTGPIPTSIGGLHSLSRLVLRDNRLHGSIPEEVGTMKLLNTLDLSNNQLTGAIPTSLGNLNDLEASKSTFSERYLANILYLNFPFHKSSKLLFHLNMRVLFGTSSSPNRRGL
ncbi:probable leucine-rich repeat receptor-like protein kinase At1g35710 [Durio zibethinus]|uniref:non-specific serine/threonine protein kinase n=1 Tax=Durio zibethinus TaxID=66656 RepID=A0A6P6AHS4_DURZI|nr:probable leucine-rich repeat receptor-like protein kinase At1g35710 [Durio zibethinus]